MAKSRQTHNGITMDNRLLKYIFLLIIAVFLNSCAPKFPQDHNEPKFSLGQWSFHTELRNGSMNNYQFVEEAKELGFDGVEYVNTFFKNKVENWTFLDSLKTISRETGVKNVLIMLDGIGELGSNEPAMRQYSIDQHKKWIKAAAYIGCEAVRINAHGNGTPDEIKVNCIESIKALAAYAKSQGIYIVVENHGGISNNGDWMLDLIKQLQPYGVYAYPDFDNWCWEREGGDFYNGKCIQLYDRYKGVNMLLPYARSLSVKAIHFNSALDEINIDFYKMMQLAKTNKYYGYLGIEYEGSDFPPHIGIAHTKALARKAWKKAKY
jgi:sugar phosphate isomerase/epimerase